MPRWAPDTRERLTRAAFELYLERGYSQTTVADIAQHAGTTERTFFRHFADKSEVLFGTNSPLQQQVIAAIRAVPLGATPLDTVITGLKAAGEYFRGDPQPFVQRQRLIASTPELVSRELHKMAMLGEAVSQTLRQRGVPDPEAQLAAEAGLAAFKVAYHDWLSGAEADWTACLQRALAHLRAVVCVP